MIDYTFEVHYNNDLGSDNIVISNLDNYTGELPYAANSFVSTRLFVLNLKILCENPIKIGSAAPN